MKGIILAGGSGTRLHPLTLVTSKQLLPVYDKPMIYYPLSVLMLAGIRDILIVSSPRDVGSFASLLGDGTSLGCNFQYAVQPEPKGIAQAFEIGKAFIGTEKVALILGDNIFYGSGFVDLVRSKTDPDGAVVFASRVNDPTPYGVVEFNENGEVLSIEEKPKSPKSNFAIPGLYFYDNDIIEISASNSPSERGELEITSINQRYLELGKLEVGVFNRGVAWLDTGTFRSLNDASTFVRVIEERQNTKIGCIEEVAYRNGYIDRESLLNLASQLGNSGYGEYLRGIGNQKN